MKVLVKEMENGAMKAVIMGGAKVAADLALRV